MVCKGRLKSREVTEAPRLRIPCVCVFSRLSRTAPSGHGLGCGPVGFLLVTGACPPPLGAACVFSERLVQLAETRVLAAALALSAGVMLYVSFVEIFVKAQGAFADAGQGECRVKMSATLCFFAGCVLMMILDKVVHALATAVAAERGARIRLRSIRSPPRRRPASAVAWRRALAPVFDVEGRPRRRPRGRRRAAAEPRPAPTRSSCAWASRALAIAIRRRARRAPSSALHTELQALLEGALRR